jgi:hypothetical protein
VRPRRHRPLLCGPSTSPLVVMASFAAVLVFWLCVAAYGSVVFRGILRGSVASRESEKGWPRGRRLVLYVVGIILTVVIVIPVAIVGVGYAFGMTDCPADSLPSQAWRCSPTGRLLFMTLGIAAGLPLAALWLRWLLGLVYRRAEP